MDFMLSMGLADRCADLLTELARAWEERLTAALAMGREVWNGGRDLLSGAEQWRAVQTDFLHDIRRTLADSSDS